MCKSPRSRPRLSAAVIAGSAMLLLAGVILSGVESALAELRYTTSYRENPIRGTTPDQLWRYMARHPIIDEDGPALANITHDHKLSVETERSGGVCRVSRLDFSWQFVITLPRAVDEAAMTPATRAMWREFTAYLKQHEEHHRTIFIGCGRSFVAAAEKLTARGSCLGLKSKVKRFIDKQYDACMEKQRAFDRDSRQSVAKLGLRRAYRR
jgi:predicted secreted Zn-dependent protease